MGACPFFIHTYLVYASTDFITVSSDIGFVPLGQDCCKRRMKSHFDPSRSLQHCRYHLAIFPI